MPLIGRVRKWLGGDDNVIYECRQCGASLDANEWACPSCGLTARVMYDLS